jgi:hypothetical protein
MLFARQCQNEIELVDHVGCSKFRASTSTGWAEL